MEELFRRICLRTLRIASEDASAEDRLLEIKLSPCIG